MRSQKLNRYLSFNKKEGDIQQVDYDKMESEKENQSRNIQRSNGANMYKTVKTAYLEKDKKQPLPP